MSPLVVSIAAPVPIYAPSGDHLLGYGIIGGMLKSGYFQGKTAADAAQKILQGTSAQEIPIVMDNKYNYKFDYRQLQRFGIKISDLPAGSIIINGPDG